MTDLSPHRRSPSHKEEDPPAQRSVFGGFESPESAEPDVVRAYLATIYRRRFTNGLVAVNPGDQPQSLRLDNALMDAATRQVLGVIELPRRSAKILLRPGTGSFTQ